MTTTTPREWYLWLSISGSVRSVLWPSDDALAINEHYHANKVRVIEYSSYEESIKLILSLEQENAKLKAALRAVLKQGIAHYSDCANYDYEDYECDCGSEKTELIVRQALEEGE